MSAGTLHDVLAELEAHGGRLVRRGEKLRVEYVDDLPADFLERLRAHKPALLALVPVRGEPLTNPDAPCTACGCGSFWQLAGAWYCESCTDAPPGITGWRHVSGGTVAPIPAPALPWPPELTDTLRRVAEHYEWTRQDIADFCRWARRSPEALADAAESLRGWAAAT